MYGCYEWTRAGRIDEVNEMKIEVSCNSCGRLTGPYNIGQDDAISVDVCSCAEGQNEDLEEKIEQLQANFQKYARHQKDCNPKPWENDCKCGFLQILKGGE